MKTLLTLVALLGLGLFTIGCEGPKAKPAPKADEKAPAAAAPAETKPADAKPAETKPAEKAPEKK